MEYGHSRVMLTLEEVGIWTNIHLQATIHLHSHQTAETYHQEVVFCRLHHGLTASQAEFLHFVPKGTSSSAGPICNTKREPRNEKNNSVVVTYKMCKHKLHGSRHQISPFLSPSRFSFSMFPCSSCCCCCCC